MNISITISNYNNDGQVYSQIKGNIVVFIQWLSLRTLHQFANSVNTVFLRLVQLIFRAGTIILLLIRLAKIG